MISKSLKWLAGVCLATAASFAAALPITGQLDFGGYATYTPNGTGGIAEVNFTDGPVIQAPHVVGATGVYALFIDLDGPVVPVTFVDPWTVAPTANLWQVNGFSFSLNTITVNENGLIKGWGTIVGNGYDETEASWRFSTQGVDGTMSFSITTVPEPATLALLGAGLIGLGVARRKTA